ncbi:hypothetical protein UFOVP1305_40 [uncultured Caudovirales phage]|uniref:Uncharacterized protein n=1 Tax=uncultured Caudovirales phage TaxID=2100421 RepID=A0A6J5RPG5_9CAUD|nr:hypothetical protein UFOVP896_78 [uncultured Caudovirales phage]CAB4197912.1 hypothetical protein UFOVP1305_40 [uncultured Caudovirales phage]
MNLKDQIAEADDLLEEVVEVPEWGVTLLIRTPTLAARASMIKRFVNEDGTSNANDLGAMYPALLIATVCDPETGAALFTTNDSDLILSKNGAIVDRIAQIALRLSGMSGDAVPLASDDSSSIESDSITTD